MSPRIPTRAVSPGLVRLLGSRGQLLSHCRSKGLQSVGGSHHHLKLADLASIVELEDIHPLQAHGTNMGAEFKNHCIVAHKLPVIGEILQDTRDAAQVQQYRGFALFWLPEDRRA